MLGVYDKNKVQHVLCRVGKVADIDKDPPCSLAMRSLCRMLFSSNKALLYDEGVSRVSRKLKPISYQAYDINYENYLEFLQILESLQTPENKYRCYKPVSTNGNEITLNLTDEPLDDTDSLSLPAQSVPQFKDSVCKLNVGNTCRHSAIALVEATQHTPISSMVSNTYFINLPYATKLDRGKPSEYIPFYVLPASPAAFPELDETKKNIITKLYKRMEHIPLIDTNSKPTQEKFLRLKDLYHQIVGPQKSLGLAELLDSIEDWKIQNKSVLSPLRKKYFWDSFFARTSATMNLITELEQEIRIAQMK
jgi:hypothetical protein